MPYITVVQSPRYHQISFEEIISGTVNTTALFVPNVSDTRTYFTKTINPNFLRRFNIAAMIEDIEKFNQQYEGLFITERSSLYEKFYIPKRSGGLREINTPVEELMAALRNLKTLFEKHMFALHHTSAYGYVKGRCAVDAVKRHQRNDSHWFLKVDFSNFFGNTTPEFVSYMLSMIFPFSEIMRGEDGRNALVKALDLCFLNGGLPQGTPISPMLTNLMMIPIDHRLCNCLRNFNQNTYIYTRYADDILISSRRTFSSEEIMRFISDTLNEFCAPFSFKREKTRYGSRNGSNWNLGVMLNKDNQITVGHKKKQRLRAALTNYTLDKKNGKNWDLHDIQILNGLMSYYKSIERDCIDAIIKRHNEKYCVDIEAMIAEDLF